MREPGYKAAEDFRDISVEMNGVPLTMAGAFEKANKTSLKRKVIYISWMSLSDKVSRDWCIDYLIEKGIFVEYWDVTSLLHGERRIGSKKTDFLRTPRTYREIQTLLCLPENHDAYYVILVSYCGMSTRLYRLLSKHDCRMLYIDWGHMPETSNRWRRLFSNPVIYARNGFDGVKAIIYRKLKLVKPFDVVLVAGQVPLAGRHYAAKVVPVNLMDYDNYVRAKVDGKRLVTERYAAFLDINLPFQYDIQLDGLSAVNANNYFKSLNRFFDLLEIKYGIKVVIAAHPTADYGIQTFQGREIYRGCTPDLVRDAEFVVSHHSTAYCYAVLDYKPILFIYTDEMNRLYKNTRVRNIIDFASCLDATILNVDEITHSDQIVIGDVNRGRYEEYKYNYLTTHTSEHSTTREIFWREINA